MPSQRLDVQGDPTTAAILINAVAESARSEFLTKLIRSLQPDDTTSIQVVSGLVSSEADSHAKDQLVSLLENFVRDGNVESAIAITSQYPELGADLFAKAVNAICEAKSIHSVDVIEQDSILPYLEYSRSILPLLTYSDAHSRLFEACLELATSMNQKMSKIATHVIYATLTGNNEPKLEGCVRSSRDMIWSSICKLLITNNKQQAIQGYSLWLRYILSVPPEHWRDLIDSQYWEMLLQGLRRGDSERRKLCLNIVKLTIPEDPDIDSKNARQQYDRYCTVFETVVLGRYINQIQECEGDLNTLAGSGDLDRKWLYVLLASALDPQMQDSNRKFIGNWVMKSNLSASDELRDFFKNDFLPWAIQGQLFVTSLKTENVVLQCLHGDRLAAFLKRLQDKDRSQWADLVADAIQGKHNTIFAYAVVYLLEGISQHLKAKHKRQIEELRGLPEVARDYINSRISTSGPSVPESRIQSRREVMELAAIENCKTDDLDVGAIQTIWADLDYLEFPKRLLLVVPGALFNPAVIQKAAEEPSIAADLAEKLQVLRKVSCTKVYTFAPIVKAIRQAVLQDPSATTILPIADFIIKICENPPEPTIDLMLEEATINLTEYKYEDYFGERPSHGFAVLLDLVSRLSQHQDIVESILTHILSRWRAQKVPPPTVSAWKNTLQLQVLALCFEQYQPASQTRIIELLEDLFHILAIEPLPRYRHLLEATTVRHIIRNDLEHTLIGRLGSNDHHGNPKHLASLMKIGTVLACRQESSPEFAASLAATFVPLAASSKIVIRHEAQWQVPILMDHCRGRKWTAITENPAYASLDSYIRSLERFSDPPSERKIGAFNPETDFTMSNLVEGQWFDLDQLEPPLTSNDEFVKLFATDSLSGDTESCIPLGPKIHRTTISKHGPETTTASLATLGPRTAIESTALQTKGTAYLARILSDPTIPTTRPHELIVVGSLVDNPYNLGGLSRVSEIFGAAALTLQNQNVVSNKDFISVAVSSHLHFPIVQLSASGVPAFLAERKQEGYQVVGIEQTDRSVVLGSQDCALPRKVVLVVGSEKEGIPGLVLTECDLLVEIPQVGVTRSLNVQTAVGIVLFEYARQHRK